MSNLFKTPAPPPVAPVPPMPDPNSPALFAASNKALADAAAAGRASTTLTTPASATLAGSYSGVQTGG